VHQLLLCIFCVLYIKKTDCNIDKVFKVSTINVLHIYKLTKKKNDMSPSVHKYISDSVYIPLRLKKRTYTLYNTARCVNTAWYINLELHRVNIHIHMFPMSHTLSKSVNISQRYKKANLTHVSVYLDVVYTLADRAGLN
jgi:hypothetical protein